MVNAATMTAYTYDANDRLLSEDISTYAYDANGNLVRRTSGTAITDYSYDFENQLVAVDTALDSVDYEYDELGNRVSASKIASGTRSSRRSSMAVSSGLSSAVVSRARAAGLRPRPGPSLRRSSATAIEMPSGLNYAAEEAVLWANHASTPT